MRLLGVIILAAGVGKRMKSKIPKVLHPICGKPMLSYVLDTAVRLKVAKIVVVIGAKMEDEIKNLRVQGFKGSKVEFVVQDPPLGTGDAVLCSESVFNELDGGLRQQGSILVLCGDVPLLTLHTISKLVKFHNDTGGVATVLTTIPPDPGSYGRIVRSGVRGQKSEVKKIVEVTDASPKIKKICEINTGIYIFDKSALFDALHKIKPSNVQKEYYLTDTIEILCKSGKGVYGYNASDWREVIGINTRKTLSEVESMLQAQIIQRHQLNGVTIKKPDTVVIDFDVKIGADTVIHPGVQLLGNTEIGEGCEIGANTIIACSFISSGTTIGEGSNIKDARL